MFVFNTTANTVTRPATATAGKAEADAIDGFFIAQVDDLSELTSPQLVILHNLLAAPKGDKLVTRFSDRETAKKRVGRYLDQAAETAGSEVGPVSSAGSDSAAAERLDQDAKEATRIEDRNRDFKMATGSEVPTGTGSTTAIMEGIKSGEIPTKPAKVKKEPKAPTAAPGARKATGPNLAPKSRVFACREGSVQALLVDQLALGWGVTFPQLKAVLHKYAAERGTKPWQDVTIRSGIGWDVNHVKGYGVTSQVLNGEGMWRECNYDAADALGWNSSTAGHPDEASEDQIKIWAEEFAQQGYDPTKTDILMRLTYPAGMEQPLPHEPIKSKAPKKA